MTKMLQRRHRRGRAELSRVVVAAAAAACLWIATVHGNPENLARLSLEAPGHVTARESSTNAGSAGAAMATGNPLTTTCGDACKGVEDAAACVLGGAPCEAPGGIPPWGVVCRGASTKCLRPDPAVWRFQFTSNPEILALAQAGINITDDPTPVITLNGTDVTEVGALDLPDGTTGLVLRAAEPGERLSVRISTEQLAKWRNVQSLVVRDIDLSTVERTLPPFPRLVSLDLSSTNLKHWPAMEAPLLSILDLSLNQVEELPQGSLPGSLTALNISYNKFRGFPPDIQAMERLHTLSIAHNVLSGLTAFPELPYLKELDISSSELLEMPSALANLPMLQSLDFSNNRLTSIAANTLPASLVTLFLRNCSLTKVPDDFNVEKTWAKIDLSLNPFPPAAFDSVMFRTSNLILERIGLTALPVATKKWAIGNELSFSGNPFGSVDTSNLPSDLSVLRLSSCSLTRIPSNLTSLYNLNTLDLSNNVLEPLTSNNLPLGLLNLNVSGCSLTSVPADVKSMQILEMLDTSFNQISEFNETLPSLTFLNLRNNSLRAIPASIFEMPHLKFLDLRGNPIADANLTSAQLSFLSKIRTFHMDKSKDPEPQVITAVPSTSPLQEKQKRSGSSKVLLSIGIGVGCLVVLVGSVMAVRKARGRKEIDQTYDPLATSRNYAPIDLWSDPELLQWRLDFLDVELVMQIGMGSQGNVWLARYKSETIVAKRLQQRKRGDAEALAKFVEEIKFLGRMEHPKIVQFLGVTWTSDADLQMLTEFMSKGNLQRFLSSSRGDELSVAWSPRKVSIAADIAEALVYLHSREPLVAHQDLRSANVYLNEQFTAKLSGARRRWSSLAKLQTQPSPKTSNRWIAPEVLLGRSKYDTAADVYALGVILTELDTHDVPFSDIALSTGEPLTETAILELLSTGALQPTISSDCPEDIAKLIHECLAFDPSTRPPAEEVLDRLRAVLTTDHESEFGEMDAISFASSMSFAKFSEVPGPDARSTMNSQVPSGYARSTMNSQAPFPCV